MKRINPLETANNTAAIPGCHAPEGCCAQCCGPLDLAKLLTESPCVMTTEVLSLFREIIEYQMQCSEPDIYSCNRVEKECD